MADMLAGKSSAAGLQGARGRRTRLDERDGEGHEGQGRRRPGPHPRARRAARRDRPERDRDRARGHARARRARRSPSQAPMHAARAGRRSAAAAAAAAAGASRRPPIPASIPGAVTSPMVGTAYLAPEPGAAPFVEVGTRVAQGQTILIIEAMKTMNQIPAPQGRHGHRHPRRERPAGRVRRAAGDHRVAFAEPARQRCSTRS